MNFVTSYSFGKDSALALYRMVHAGHTPVALLTTVNTQQQRSWVHGIQPPLMQAVAESLSLPLILCECTTTEYAYGLKTGLLQAKHEYGAEAAVFGDIDIEGHAAFNHACCAATGLACEMPLWQGGRKALVEECINAGFKAMLKTVQTGVLPDEMLGQTLTLELAREIEATGADICGENGEYHTFVYDGPLFANPIPLQNNGIVDLGTNKAADLQLAPSTNCL